jgi:hypothetical protein
VDEVIFCLNKNALGADILLVFCFSIPNPSHFEQDIEDWDESMTTAFAQAMSEVNNLILMKYFLDTEK